MERRRLVGRQPPPPAYRIRGVFEELNFPSRDKLKTALKKRGIRFTDDEIDAVIKCMTSLTYDKFSLIGQPQSKYTAQWNNLFG